MDLKSLKIGQTTVTGSKLQLDVMEEVDHKGKWGWEITDEHGDVVDQKYGFNSHDAANKAGETEMKKFKSTAATKNVFDQAEKVANQGHYLERILGLAKVFKLSKELIAVLEATLKYVRSSHKPQWIDGLTYEVSNSIIYAAEQLNPTPEDWEKIVYGLDHVAMNEAGLQKHQATRHEKTKDNHSARENH